MKVLLINGSPKREGNTFLALSEAEKALNECGVETEILWIGNKPVQGCIACYKCMELGHCIFRDELTKTLEAKAEECDALIVGSPIYYAGPAGALCALLDRLFMAHSRYLQYKPAASVVVCRRGGASAGFDRLNKYFQMTNMPVVSSQYWNMVYGSTPGEVKMDEEGMQTMRTLGRNMAWVLKSIENQPKPEPEEHLWTNFIR